jgi:Ni/Co efflux regulator RcnB
MKRFILAATALALTMGIAGAASAQPGNDRDHRGGYQQNERYDNNNDHHYVRHDEWRKGRRMSQNDWRRGQRVDYRAHHLRAPPRGYEWREVDGNYVMAAVATGLIASIIANSH